ncbi:MAG: pantetheine-phosphate adenylyltransferase [Candidatus Delongbacteria bacterium]|jgi:pantetheine-phosphate adenylyltransferase|nr:pantetheine-phosphate adenylyltransferase [Candidatus Delongbacteria bacterium]
MKKIALFPGSFDPFTVGHESIVNRALPLFDELVIGIGVNQDKHKLFPLDKRVEWIKALFKHEQKLSVQVFEGLTVDFCKKINAEYVLRGLRTSADFEYERAIGQTNKVLDEGIETVFLLTRPEHTFISSSIVKDVFKNGGDISKFIPEGIKIDV